MTLFASWHILQSNLALSAQISKLAGTVGVKDFVLLAYLSQQASSLSLVSTPTGERLLDAFIQMFNVDVFVTPEAIVPLFLGQLNGATAILGWQWSLVKEPKHRIDALVLAVTLPNGDKMAIKSHLANYPIAYTNYTVPCLRARINALDNTTTITAHKIFIDSQFQMPFYVLMYPFVEGRLLSELDAEVSRRSLVQLNELLSRHGFSTHERANPEDVVVDDKSGDLILTDWNKITADDNLFVDLPDFRRKPFYRYKNSN